MNQTHSESSVQDNRMGGAWAVLAEETVKAFPLSDPKIIFLRHNENVVFQVRDGTDTYVLRLHCSRKGFETGILGECQTGWIEDELILLDHLHSEEQVTVPSPVRTQTGAWVAEVRGIQATLLRWVDGTSLRDQHVHRDQLLRVGQMMGHLRCHCRNHPKPHLRRPRYNKKLLQRIGSCIARSTCLNTYRKELLGAVLEQSTQVFTDMEREGSMWGYIHADLSPGNILSTPEGVALIDFGMSGHGFWMQDIGGACASFSNPEQRAAILCGYESVCGTVDIRSADPFFALSVLLFISSQLERAQEWDWFPAALERWCTTVFTPLVRGDPVFDIG